MWGFVNVREVVFSGPAVVRIVIVLGCSVPLSCVCVEVSGGLCCGVGGVVACLFPGALLSCAV